MIAPQRWPSEPSDLGANLAKILLARTTSSSLAAELPGDQNRRRPLCFRSFNCSTGRPPACRARSRRQRSYGVVPPPWRNRVGCIEVETHLRALPEAIAAPNPAVPFAQQVGTRPSYNVYQQDRYICQIPH